MLQKSSRCELKQKAELRVVLHNNGRYHLLLYANLNGFELVHGPGLHMHGFEPLPGSTERQKVDLRSVWHETGSTNMHTPIGVQSRQKVRPEIFQGKEQLGGASSGGLISWDYRPRQESKIRRTLIVDTPDWVGGGCTAALWAVEKGRDDLVGEIVTPKGYVGRMVEVVGYIRSEWTHPQLVALLQTLTPQAHGALEHSTGRSFHKPKLKKI